MSHCRNIPIEAFRFLVMLQICLWHYSHCIGKMEAGYIGVEFFFILSGVFLYKIASSNKNIGILQYTFSKIRKFYLAYVLALIFSYLIYSKMLFASILHNPIHELCRFIGQLLLIQNIGVVQGGVNAPLWFFSVLIYGCGLVFGLTKYYTKVSIRVIFPLLCLLFYSGIFNFQNGVGLEQWTVSAGIPIPFTRGVVDIVLGVLVGYCAFNYRTTLISLTKIFNLLFIIATCGYLAIVFFSNLDAPYALFFIVIILLSTLNPHSIAHRIFKSTIWLKLGNCTFELFLIHIMLVVTIKFFEIRLELSSSFGLFIYTVALLPAAYIFKRIVDYLRRCLMILVRGEK